MIQRAFGNSKPLEKTPTRLQCLHGAAPRVSCSKLISFTCDDLSTHYFRLVCKNLHTYIKARKRIFMYNSELSSILPNAMLLFLVIARAECTR